MLKKIFNKTQRCIAERRWPRFVFIERVLHALRMRFETMVFHRRVSESAGYDLECGRKYLYASPVGLEGKERLAKVISKFGHQNFDYLIFAWDMVRFDEDIFKKCKVIYEKGCKWFFIKKYLTPDFCRQYAYLFLWDDDLDVEHFDYLDFIAIMKHNKLQIAQPALSEDSYATHAITVRQKDGVGRYVDFVEIMAQVFHESAWERFWEMMEADRNFWGFGYDNLARAVCSYKNMGIIDRQFVSHVRPCRRNDLAAREGYLFSSKFPKKLLAKQVSYGKLKSPSSKPRTEECLRLSSEAPTISFIIPCYNMEKWIEQAIQSCLQQKNIRSEVIVIDDGSNDNSRKVIQQFSGRIRWEAAGSNQGVNRTRNRGISLASGEFVLFLDADDFLEPDTVFRQVELLEDRAADICYADWKYWMMRPKGSWQSKPHNGKRSPGDDLTVSLLKDWWCPPFAYLYRKRFILENNLFWNENLGFPDDFEYILKASLKQPAVVYHPVVTGYYRKHIGSRLSGITTEKWAKNVVFIYELAEDQLRNQNRWKEPYIDAVCSGYLGVGRRMFKYDPNFFQQMLDKIHQLKPNFCASRKRYRWAAQILGYERAERLAQLKRRGRAMIEALVCKVRGE